MKYTSFAVVMALLGSAAVTARRHHHHHRHGSNHARRDLLELNHIDEWDPALSKFMGADEYMKDVKHSLDFGDEEEMPKKHHKHGALTQKPKPAPKKEVPKPVVKIEKKQSVAQINNKAKEEDKPHYFDNIAEDRKQFAEVEPNTRTANGEVRRASDEYENVQQQYKKEEVKMQKQLVQRDQKIKKQTEEKENAEKTVQLMNAEKERQVNNQIAEMNHQWVLFERGLEVENWEKAQALWADLEHNNHPQPILKVDTRKQYEGQFKFPEVAKNDQAVAWLDQLETAQINLNNNSDNRSLLNKFVAAAQDTAEKLVKQYPEVWSDPGIEVKKELRNKSLAEKAKFDMDW